MEMSVWCHFDMRSFGVSDNLLDKRIFDAWVDFTSLIQQLNHLCANNIFKT